MEYGKNQGEICAAAHISGATGAASLIGNPYNVASVAHTGAVGSGTYAVTLSDGVDPLDCAVVVTGDTTPATGTADNAAADTDTVKNVAMVDAAGAALNVGFYIVVVRTNVG